MEDQYALSASIVEERKRPITIFGLSREQLWPIVESIAGETITDFSMVFHDQVQGFPGWAGDKLVPTVSFSTSAGIQEQQRLFVKRLHPGAHEALHYAYLHNHNLPVAYLYGVVLGAQKEEILFLERLDRTFNGITAAYPEIRRYFLDLLARFHTLELTPDYLAQLTTCNITEHLAPDRISLTLQRVWTQAIEGHVGSKLQELCCRTYLHLPALIQFANELLQRIQDLPPGLTNGEFGLGLHPGTDEWQLFDLHSIALRPRFVDLTHLFGQPEQMQSVYGPSWRAQPELARFYLQQLANYGGPVISLDELYAETADLWFTHALNLDWWLELALTGNVVWTSNRKVGRRHCRQQLYLLLSALVNSVRGSA